MNSSRRTSIKKIGLTLASLPFVSILDTEAATKISSDNPMFFKISLAQWSLHRSFFGDLKKIGWVEFGKLLQSNPDALLNGELNPVDFPKIAKQDYGIDAIEYVNTFYFGKAKNEEFWKSMKMRCDDEGVKSLLIMCDALGDLGDANKKSRTSAVENHKPWLHAAATLGCHSIRVNAAGKGSADEVAKNAADGLSQLSELAQPLGLNVIVENHGGYSSDGKWLASVMQQVNKPNCGTLPDFGNFCIENKGGKCINEYNRYDGVRELMSYAKGVSAKSHEFDKQGNEVRTDYQRMLEIVKAAGYTGYIGIEYEGDQLSESDGIKATKALLEKIGNQLK